jgi:hypothetical protein
MIGLLMLGASLNGCSPGGTAPPATVATSTSPAILVTTSGPAQKAGRRNVDTTSRRELHKQRAEERAKSK